MNNLINHVCLILDASSSMTDLTKDVIKVADNQIKFLAELSKKFDQETRVSVYVFADSVKNIIFDKDVLRLPSMAEHYHPFGNTALIDAVVQGIDDLKDTSVLYGDHAFLLYVLTDGEDNRSSKFDKFKALVNSLTDNWTVSALVPNNNSKVYDVKFGFPAGNVEIWNVSAKGVEEVGLRMEAVTTNYMENRAKGIRGSKNLFQLDTSGLKAKTLNKELEPLKPSEYTTYRVSKDTTIKEFIKKRTGEDYVISSCYYLLMKKETIQTSKQIILINKKNGKAYAGDNARTLLGLPDHEVKVAPANADYHIFVQSTSVNRKLIGGTDVLVRN